MTIHKINGVDRDIRPCADLHGADLYGANLYGADEARSRAESPRSSSGRGFPGQDEEVNDGGSPPPQQNQDGGGGGGGGLKVLPFEFVALEACLEAACSVLDNEVSKSSCF